MCLFKKKEKKKETFKDWNENINNFGFNKRSKKLQGEFETTNKNTPSKNNENKK